MPKTALFSNHQPGGVFTIQAMEEHPNNVWFVSSTHAAAANSVGSGQGPDRPFATLAYAFSSALPAAGDVIYVMPGHVESLGAAGAIAANIAGVRVIGLGWGASRPTFTWHTTDATIAVSAASIQFKNIICTVDIDEVVSMWNITAAHCTLDGVDYADAGATQAIQFILTTNAADQLTVKNCRHVMLTAPAATSVWIQLVGCNEARILDNFFRLVLANAAGAFTIGGTTDPPGCEIARNTIVQTGGTTQAAAIKLTTGTGCFVHDNRVACGSTALPGIVAVGSAGYGAENYALNTPNVSGIIDPVADS